MKLFIVVLRHWRVTLPDLRYKADWLEPGVSWVSSAIPAVSFVLVLRMCNLRVGRTALGNTTRINDHLGA